jgi:outer membrane receptor for ferrienterochelin and colicin
MGDVQPTGSPRWSAARALGASTATKTAMAVADAPAIITVISAEDIERWGYTSVAEALQHVVGFYLTDDHVVPNAAVRGVAAGSAPRAASSRS